MNQPHFLETRLVAVLRGLKKIDCDGPRRRLPRVLSSGGRTAGTSLVEGERYAVESSRVGVWAALTRIALSLPDDGPLPPSTSLKKLDVPAGRLFFGGKRGGSLFELMLAAMSLSIFASCPLGAMTIRMAPVAF